MCGYAFIILLLFSQKIVGNRWTNSIEHNILFILQYKLSNAIDQNSFFCGVENGVKKNNKNNNKNGNNQNYDQTMTWWIVTVDICYCCCNQQSNFLLHSFFLLFVHYVKLFIYYIKFDFWWYFVEILISTWFLWDQKTSHNYLTPKLLIKPLSKQPINTVLFHSNIFHFLYSSLLCTLCKAILYDRIFSIHSKSKF